MDRTCQKCWTEINVYDESMVRWFWEPSSVLAYALRIVAKLRRL